MEEKITLKEFFDSKEKLAIRCDTEEKANTLLKEFDKLGQKWDSGNSYLEHNCWGVYSNKTCYTNDNCYCDKECLLDHNFKIYEFEDIIL